MIRRSFPRRRTGVSTFLSLVLLAAAVALPALLPGRAGEVAASVTYYVDSAGGSDSYSGTSEAYPWRTLAKVSGRDLQPGDTVLLRRARTWRETLRVPTSGSSSARITFGAYGAGARPIIMGSENSGDDGCVWRASGHGANEYYLTGAGGGPTGYSMPGDDDAYPGWLWDADSQTHLLKGRIAGRYAGSLADGEWDWADNDGLGFATIYLRHDGGTPGAIEVPQRDGCILVNSESHLRFDGLSLRFSNTVGLYFMDYSRGYAVTDCEVFGAARSGISIAGPGQNLTADALIDSNWIHDCGGRGIGVASGSPYAMISGVTISNNEVHDQVQGRYDFDGGHLFDGYGINLFWVIDSRITGNHISGTHRHGIHLDGDTGATEAGCSNVEIDDNLCHDNGGAGIVLESATDCRVHHNTFRDHGSVLSWHGGIYVSTYSRGNQIDHNLVYGASTGPQVSIERSSYNTKFWNNTIISGHGQGVTFSADSAPGTNFKNNIIYAPSYPLTFGNQYGPTSNNNFLVTTNGGQNRVCPNGVWPYYSLAEWYALSGQDLRSAAGDPLFTNPTAGDYTLGAGSPCIDAGVSVGLPYAGAAPDMGALEDGDTTPPPPEDDEWTLQVESTPIAGLGITGSHAGATDYTVVVTDGTAVTLTAPAVASSGATNYGFDYWTVGGAPQPAGQQTIALTVDADVTAVAVYSRREWTVWCQATPILGVALTGTPAGTTNYTAQCDDDETVDLTAPQTVVKDGTTYTFLRWDVDGAPQPAGQRTLTHTVDANVQLSAAYEAQQDAVALSVESTPLASVAIAGSHPGVTDYAVDLTAGTTVTLTAPAAAADGATDYDFSHWTIDGVPQPAGQRTVTTTVNANLAAVAAYTRRQWTVSCQTTPILGVAIAGTPGGTTNYSAQRDDNSSVSLTAPQSVLEGGTTYHFLRWDVDGTPQAAGQLTVSRTVNADLQLTAAYEAQQATMALTVQSTPVQGLTVTGSHAGTTDYAVDLAAGTSVTLTAPAAAADGATDYDFAHWTVDGVTQTAGEPTLNLTVGAATTAVAVYERRQRTVWCQASPILGVTFTGTPGGRTNYTVLRDDNSTVTLTAPQTVVKDGTTYDFLRWDVDRVPQAAGQRTLTHTVNANVQLSAAYEAQQATVTLSVQSTPVQGLAVTGTHAGTTDYAMDLASGTAVTLTAPAAAADGATDYDFSHWTVGGVPQPAGQRTIATTVNADLTVVAAYARRQWTVSCQTTPILGVAIAGTPAGTTNYSTQRDDSSSVSLTAPQSVLEGGTTYHFLRWEVDGTPQAAGQLTVSRTVNANVQLTAVYEAQQSSTATLSVRATPAASVSVTGSHPGTTDYAVSLDAGTSVSLAAPATTANGETDYEFEHWTVDGVQQTAGQRTIGLTVDADVTAVAVYSRPSRRLWVQSTPSYGVPVTGTHTDWTHYIRYYDDNTPVTAIVPATFDFSGSTLTFARWVVDGQAQPAGQRTLTLNLNANVIAVAVYEDGTPPPVEEHTVQVESTPVTGVAVTGSHAGTTNYSTQVEDGTSVSLTAPATFAAGSKDYVFARWTLDGANQPAGQRTLAFAASADRTARAEYTVQQRSLNVLSSPLTGVSVTGTASGTTDYSAGLDDDTAVTLTAPQQIASDLVTYTFARWELNGAARPTGQTTLSFTLSADSTALAVYQSTASVSYMLWVDSEGVAGVPISGSHGGTTDYAAEVPEGTAVTLIAPATYSVGGVEYQFVRWLYNGGLIPMPAGQTTLAFTLDEHQQQIAVYQPR